jgi:hypothetical protein
MVGKASIFWPNVRERHEGQVRRPCKAVPASGSPGETAKTGPRGHLAAVPTSGHQGQTVKKLLSWSVSPTTALGATPLTVAPSAICRRACASSDGSVVPQPAKPPLPARTSTAGPRHGARPQLR